MPHDNLADLVQTISTEFGIPGVAVGVWADGEEVYTSHGVTSIDNPLPVDNDTLYVLGSVTKTVTATTVMRLVAYGRVELDAPVRRYVPELRLADGCRPAGRGEEPGVPSPRQPLTRPVVVSVVGDQRGCDMGWHCASWLGHRCLD